MAPSSMLLALLVTFAMVAPSSMAARDGGAAKAAAAAPASDEVLQPMGLFDRIRQIIGEIPDLPLPRIVPCPPAFPKIPFIPCYNETSPSPPPLVTECRTPLAKHTTPCAGYLTDGASALSPPKKCCDGVTSMLLDGYGGMTLLPLCLCHIKNGDADKLYQAPVNHTRAMSIMESCGLGVRPGDFDILCSDGSLDVPPMDAPTDPPSHGTNNAGSS